jgi:hypothetical protein
MRTALRTGLVPAFTFRRDAVRTVASVRRDLLAQRDPLFIADGVELAGRERTIA